MTVHSFETSHAFGEAAADDPLWEAFYRKAFPGLVTMLKNARGNTAQYAGIDRWLCMSSGKTLTVDEKKRSKEYPDILLEYISNDRMKTPGWIEKDLAIDYLAYAFMAARKCYLFPWPALRASWLRCGKEWIAIGERCESGFEIVRALNQNYTTLSVAVPTALLLKSVAASLTVQLEQAIAAVA
jgi:hypothetical protein